MDAAVRHAYATALEIIPGADQLARAWPHAKAVASSSSQQLVELKLARVGLGDVFGDSIFTADNFRAKPHPDLFLASADHLNIHPQSCVVVEDSVNGVIAAKRAGMKVIGFTGGGHCLPDHPTLLTESGADWVFDSFSGIKQLLLH